MHNVTSRVRKILPADLPKIRQDDGTERAATAQDLLNLGIIPTGEPNTYDCREQVNDAETPGTMKPVVVIPGTILSEGPRRLQALPPAIRDRVLQTVVYRSTDVAAPNLLQTLEERVKTAPAEERAQRILELARKDAADPLVLVDGKRVAMADLSRTSDVVEAEGLPPSQWSGESTS